MALSSARASRSLIAAACVAPLVAFLLIYVPKAGRGFVADDFEWAISNRLRAASDVRDVFLRHNGFYRPVVALTFGINEVTAGSAAKAYGFTNVLLALGGGAQSSRSPRRYACRRAPRHWRPPCGY